MEKVKLGDVAIEKRETWTGSTQGVPIVGLEHLVPGEVTLSSWDSDTDNTFSKMFRKGQVLLGRRRVYLKKAVIAPFDGICSGDITVIEAIPGKISSRLLPFVIQNERFFDYAMQGSAGSLSPRVKWEHLKDYEFNLPNYEEQDCLADKLWSALKLKESYQRLLAATDEMVKSRFIEMFCNPLLSEQNYPLRKLGECVEINPRRGFIPLSDSDLVSFVPMPAVNEEGYLQDVTDVEYGSVKKGFTYFKNGDILFAKITPCMENGKGAIAENLTNNIGMGSTEFHVLRPITNVSLEYWILALTRLPVFREKAAKNMTGTGGQKRVPSSFLSEFKVGLPPISAQEEFANVYKQADKSKFNGFKSRFIEKFGNHMQKQLSDIATSWDKGQPFKKDSIIDNGARPCIHYGELYKYGPVIDRVVSFTDEVAIKKSNNGDILFPASDVTPYGLARCSALMTNGVLLGGDIIVLRISNDNSPEYVSYAINMQQDQLIRRVTGSVVRHMSAKSLKTVEIPIPSLDAQHQFVSLLRQADKSKYLS